jgi:hypothetical protein
VWHAGFGPARSRVLGAAYAARQGVISWVAV